MRNKRPNTTQRSWDDYVGDKPIKAWKKKGFYENSPRHADGGDPNYIPPGYERDPATGRLRKQRGGGAASETSPSSSSSSSRFGETASTDQTPVTPMRQSFDRLNQTIKDLESNSSERPGKDDGSALPRGYSFDKDGKVVNSAGVKQDDDWYTVDPKTGKKRLKRVDESGMYVRRTDGSLV